MFGCADLQKSVEFVVLVILTSVGKEPTYACALVLYVRTLIRGETVSNTATSQGARTGGYFRHIRGDLVRNTGDGCEGEGGGTDAGCVASSSFTDGGTDEATGEPKKTVFQNTFLIDGYFAEACEDE